MSFLTHDGSPRETSGETPLAPEIASARVVDLNLLKVRILSNLPDFPAYDYFTRFAADDAPVDYEICCVDTGHNQGEDAALEALIAKSRRVKRFDEEDFPLLDAGRPVYLLTYGRMYYLFGRALEKTVWECLLKYVLTLFAVDRGCLHLNAGAFAFPDAGATLVLGGKGAGKSLFVAQAAHEGARFIADSHTLICGETAYAVPTALHDQGILRDPEKYFARPATNQAPVRNMVLVDYRPDCGSRFERMTPELAREFFTDFVLPVDSYGFRDELFAYFDYDLDRYSRTYQRMKDQLAGLVGTADCYIANVDMLDSLARSSVLDTLS